MPDARALLSVARLLAGSTAPQGPGDAQLRRAVSTAYYALFHHVLRRAAEQFMGPGSEGSAGYALIYRGFDHGRMKAVCEALDVPTLKEKFRFSLKRSAVGQDMRNFASTFPALQEVRHLADYHPSVVFAPSDVASLIDTAEVAIEAFDRAPADERADVMALLMVGARG